MNLIVGQLQERFEIIANKKVKNFPFLMGEGVWIDSENLGWNDTIREVLMHGTLSIALSALRKRWLPCGTHRREPQRDQNLGLEIVWVSCASSATT